MVGKDEDGVPNGLLVDETVLLDDHKYLADVVAEAHAAHAASGAAPAPPCIYFLNGRFESFSPALLALVPSLRGCPVSVFARHTHFAMRSFHHEACHPISAVPIAQCHVPALPSAL